MTILACYDAALFISKSNFLRKLYLEKYVYNYHTQARTHSARRDRASNLGRVLFIVLAAGALTACQTVPPRLNLDGQPVTFAEPILGSDERDSGVYVLLEKNLRDGKYAVVNISDQRQAIQNERQERVVFNRELTRYAPDFPAEYFSTYSSDQRTVIANCEDRSTRKKVEYSPCSSEFAKVFIPNSAVTSYVAGRMAYETWLDWKNPRVNVRRMVASPEGALIEAGVFENLEQLRLGDGDTVVAATGNAVASTVQAVAAGDSELASEDKSLRPLEVNNAWQVFEGQNIRAPLFVKIEPRDLYWEVTDIQERPFKALRDEAGEVFVASRDLQYWEAYGPKSAIQCNTFEAREYRYKSPCTSALTEKKMTRAILGMLFGKFDTNGEVPIGYSSEKVTAAIRSIRPEQAQAMLDAFDAQ